MCVLSVSSDRWASEACVGLYGLSAAVCMCTHQCQAHTPPDPRHHWDTRLTPPAGHLSSEREYRIQVQTVHFYMFGGRFHSIGFLYNLEKQPWKLWQLSFLASFLLSPHLAFVIFEHLCLSGVDFFLLKLNKFQLSFFFFSQIFSLTFFSTVQI